MDIKKRWLTFFQQSAYIKYRCSGIRCENGVYRHYSWTNATDSVSFKAVCRVDIKAVSGEMPDFRETKSPAEAEPCPDDYEFVVALTLGFRQAASKISLRLGGRRIVFRLTNNQKP